MKPNSAVVEKAKKIHREGLRALKSGNVQLFPGLPNMLKSKENRFFVGAGIQLEDYPNIGIRMVLQEIERISYHLGVFHIFQAGREFPLHFTIGEGEYKGENKNNVFCLLKEKMEPWWPANIQQKNVFDTLVLDKANILLTASNIPHEIIEMRHKLNLIYERHGLVPLKIENLLHITLGRIDRWEEDVANRRKQLNYYVKMMSGLRDYIKINPIDIYASILWHLPSADFLADIRMDARIV